VNRHRLNREGAQVSDTIIAAIIGVLGTLLGFGLAQWSQSSIIRAADRRALRDARRERLRTLYEAIMEGLVERKAALDLMAPDAGLVPIGQRAKIVEEAAERLVKSSLKASNALSLEADSVDVLIQYKQMNDDFLKFVQYLSSVPDEEVQRRRRDVATRKEQLRKQIDTVQDLMAAHLVKLEQPI
jgi:hypothetical protein